jgi:hypothetical protein
MLGYFEQRYASFPTREKPRPDPTGVEILIPSFLVRVADFQKCRDFLAPSSEIHGASGPPRVSPSWLFGTMFGTMSLERLNCSVFGVLRFLGVIADCLRNSWRVGSASRFPSWLFGTMFGTMSLERLNCSVFGVLRFLGVIADWGSETHGTSLHLAFPRVDCSALCSALSLWTG